MPSLVITRLIIKSETAKATFYHGTIQQCYENNSKEILSIYSLRLLSIFLSIQGLTL